MRCTALLVTFVAACSLPTSDAPPTDANDPDATVEDEPEAVCKPPARGALPVDLAPALGGATFAYPVDVVWAPGVGEYAYVVESVGTVQRVDLSTSEVTPFLDLRNHLERYTGEVGLWDIAFHPQYPDVPYAYVFLTGNGGATDFQSMLLRFTTRDGGATLDTSSEETLLVLERMAGGLHSGGKIGFASDGMLWISTGDGDGYGDPLGRAQDPHSLLGKMLRIDVDAGAPYAIPADNPFVNGGAAPEIFALGFRNPWRWSFDRATDDVWVGDVGHDRFEEIDRIVAGGNYGWRNREAFACWGVDPCDGDFIDPVYAYGRDQGASVIGGYVYRGAAIPELVGHYVFGDYASGRIWALFDDGPKLLAETGTTLAAFAETPEGELLVTEVVAGRIAQLVPAPAGHPGVPALWLADTHCLTDPRLVGYDVNAPLWSDGLAKERGIVVPKGTHAQLGADGNWQFPDGTVLVKTFAYEGQPIETRLLVRSDDAWSGWTYQWLPDGTNALRVDDGGTRDLGDLTWTFPSTAECTRCHTAAAGQVLGFHPAQLAHGTQLSELHARGVIDEIAPPASPLAGLAESSASLERRARSYLHANCSMCHRPGGGAQGDLDLRFDVPLADTNTCDRVPQFGTLGISEDARVIAPGDPSRSVLLARIGSRGEGQMPPIATARVDAQAVAVIAQWIASLGGCQ